MSYKSIGKEQVAVPTHSFKIVRDRRAKEGPWKAIAFVMENKAYNKPFQFEKYIQSVE